jgi:hypothetical protein
MGGRGSGRRVDAAKRKRAAALGAEALGVSKQGAHYLLTDGPRRGAGPTVTARTTRQGPG